MRTQEQIMADLDARFNYVDGPVRSLPLSMASKPPDDSPKRCYGPAFTIAAYPTETLQGPRPSRKGQTIPKELCQHDGGWNRIRKVVTKKGIAKLRTRCRLCLMERTVMPDQVHSTYEKRRKQ